MCPPPDQLEKLADGALAPDREEALRSHAASCAECAAFLEEVGRIDAAIIEGIATKAGRPGIPRIIRFALAASAAAAVFLLTWIFVHQERPLSAPDYIEIAHSAPPSRPVVAAGDAQIRAAGTETLRGAVENAPLGAGDVVVTDEGQQARVDLPDQGELYLNEKTSVFIPSSAEETLALDQGEVVARPGRRPLRIRTPEGVAEFDNAEARIVSNPKEVRVALIDGQGGFRPRQGRTQKLKKGEELVIPRGKKPSRVKKKPNAAWTRKLRSVEFLDTFRGSDLTPVWKAHPKDEKRWSIARREGERILSIASPVGQKKRRTASLVNRHAFVLKEPLLFEFRVRQPNPGAGRTAIVLGGSAHKKKMFIRYTLGARDESLELLVPGEKRARRIWSERGLRPNRGWVTIRLRLGPKTLSLNRNDVNRITHEHGVDELPPLRLQLHSIGKEWRSFESQFSRIFVQRIAVD